MLHEFVQRAALGHCRQLGSGPAACDSLVESRVLAGGGAALYAICANQACDAFAVRRCEAQQAENTANCCLHLPGAEVTGGSGG